MLARPSLSTIFATAWALFRQRGWLILAVIILTGLPRELYAFAVYQQVVPNWMDWIQPLIGSPPTLADTHPFALWFYVQKSAFIKSVASAILFGFIQAVSIILVARIAVSWSHAQDLSWASLFRGWLPSLFIVWAVITIIKILSGLGVILLILPGVVVMTFLFVAPFIAAMEDCGPITALRRSFALSRGHWLTIFLLICLLVFAEFAWGVFRGAVMARWWMEMGLDVKYWIVTNMAVQSFAFIFKNLAGMILTASTYLVLTRAETGVSDGDIAGVF